MQNIIALIFLARHLCKAKRLQYFDRCRIRNFRVSAYCLKSQLRKAVIQKCPAYFPGEASAAMLFVEQVSEGRIRARAGRR